MHELADAIHDLHLVRLQLTDEVPAEGVAVLRVLGLEILGAVLADDRDAGFGERSPCRRARRTSSRRRRSRPARPVAARSARRARICSGDSTDHSLHAACAAIAAVGEEELGVVARAEVEAIDASRRRPCEARVRRRTRDRACRRVSGRRRSGPTPPSRPRSSTGRSPARSRPPSRPARAPPTPACTIPSESPRQPACRTASAARPVAGARDGDREAVGGHREQRHVCVLRPEAVARRAAQPWRRAMHGRRMHLPVEGEPLGGQAERLTRDPAVLLDALGAVAGSTRQVEGVVRRLADAAERGS